MSLNRLIQYEFKQELERCGKHSFFITSEGEKVERISFGKEGECIPLEYNAPDAVFHRDYCDDCGIKKGEYHMADCDIEICPLCKNKYLVVSVICF